MTDRVIWMAAGFIIGVPAGWCLLGLALLFRPEPDSHLLDRARQEGGL